MGCQRSETIYFSNDIVSEQVSTALVYYDNHPCYRLHTVSMLEFFCSSNDNALQRKATKQDLCLLAAILIEAHVQMLQEEKTLEFLIFH